MSSTRCLSSLSAVLLMLGIVSLSSSAMAQETLPEVEVNQEVPVRVDRSVGIALEVPFVVSPPAASATDDVEMLPVPGVRFSLTAWSWLAFEGRLHSVIFLNTLQAGARWWMLEGNFSPSLFALAGVGYSPFQADDGARDEAVLDNEGFFPLATVGGALDYLFDSGFNLSLEVSALVVNLNGQPFNVAVTPSLGYHF